MRAAPRSFLLMIVLLTGLSASAGMRVASGFTFNGVSNRFLTPNGDRRNDNIAFNFSNPTDAAGTVKIYDLRGRLQTTIAIAAGTGATSAVWDGRAGGETVATGVYIYVVSVESVVVSGAVVVIR